MSGDTTKDELPPRPEPDELARRVAKARIAEKLFASGERVQIGRYHLIEMVGEGGMGVVWGAWDPELERRVAIKLVNATSGSTRDRILAEGQALAKLSHPNVVPVFDVGVIDERVYLVMEWVRGKNLREWCADEARDDRAILAVYRAAGMGLLAAHEAGLVHRDFKPDNAVVGDDGRVRVLDFGLARSENVGATSGDGTVTRGAGTPRYMAPEQAAGGELTAAADQYAFGVSLREALGKTDVPAWIEAILVRSTAPTPAERFASMADLVAAIDRDPRIVWRRRILVGAAVLAAGGAFAAGTMRGDHVERCSGARAEIATVWNDTLRTTLVGRLRGLGGYGEIVAGQLAPELDAYATRWVTASQGACKAADTGELPPARYELDRGCLARARAGLAAASDVLSRAEASRLPDAVLAARSLPDPARCALEAESSTVPPPSMMLAPRAAELANEVARARVLALAIDPSAVSVAEATAASAARLGYQPLAARAQLAYGIALLFQRERARAADALDQAQSIAFGAGDTATGVEAFAREIFAIATASTTLPASSEQAIAASQMVQNLAQGLGPTGAFERSLLLNNLGSLRMSKGDRDGARVMFEAALAARPPVTGETYELASAPGNLALVENDAARRAELFAQQRSELVSVVGGDHPRTLEVRAAAAAFSRDGATARRELHDVGERIHRLHPHLATQFGWVGYELFWLAFDDGDLGVAREASGWLGDDIDGSLAHAYLRIATEPARASSDARAIAEQLLATDQAFSRWRAIDALVVVALAQPRSAHAASADAITRALDLSTRVSPFDHTVFYDRRVARLHALRDQ